MSGAHAKLGPSSAERWLNCPGSVRLIDEEFPNGVEQSESPYALEGTQAHALAELRSAEYFDLISDENYERRLKKWMKWVPADKHDEMWDHVTGYIEVLVDIIGDCENPVILLERRVYPGVSGVWGTADTIIVTEGCISAIDFKYGMGVVVHPAENPQLRFYALGAANLVDETLGLSTDAIQLVVYQPRVYPALSTSTESLEQLIQWRDNEAAPQAHLALSGLGYLAPSEEACRWCPVAGICKARMEWSTKRDFGEPEMMDNTELAQALADLPNVESWCADVRSAALEKVEVREQHIPGWKLVRANGKRSITDHGAAIDLMLEQGYSREQVARPNSQTLGVLEKLVGGKEALGTMLGDLLKKSEGKKVLAPADDERPAIDANAEAANDFESIDDSDSKKGDK